MTATPELDVPRGASGLSPDEVAYIVNDSSAKAIIAAYSNRDLAGAIAGGIPAVSIRLAFGGPVGGFGSYEDALAATSAEPLPEQPRGADMLYSSGTTGYRGGRLAPELPLRPPRLISWETMTLRWISLVPSPTIISGASRKYRSTSNSVE